jgi:(R,R)-butanediol dehydrogenase / meso-butanediol dehydrogenase / diacetyl reductase
VLHEKTVRGSAAHMYDDDVQVGVGMLADGTLSVDGLVTHRIALADVVEEGFERLRRRDPDALKVLVDCAGGARTA